MRAKILEMKKVELRELEQGEDKRAASRSYYQGEDKRAVSLACPSYLLNSSLVPNCSLVLPLASGAGEGGGLARS
jgi:hypothetical protein